jgi:hypothetical protein
MVDNLRGRPHPSHRERILEPGERDGSASGGQLRVATDAISFGQDGRALR